MWIALAVDSGLFTVLVLGLQVELGSFLIDGSNHETVRFCSNIADQDARITFVLNPRRLGVSGNYQKCSTLGNTDHLLLLAADDVLAQKFVEKVTNVIETNSSFGMICTQRVLVGPNRLSRKIHAPYIGAQSPGSTIPRALASGNLYGLYSSVVVNRKVLQDVGGVPKNNPFGDFELFLQIAAMHSIFYADARVYQWWDASTQTARYVQDGSVITYEEDMFHRLLTASPNEDLRRLLRTPVAWTRLYNLGWLLAIYNLSHGNWRGAKLCVERAMQVQRTAPVCLATLGSASMMLRLLWNRIRLQY